MKICLVGAQLFHADGGADRWMDRQIDRYGEANNNSNCFLQLCECTQ